MVIRKSTRVLIFIIGLTSAVALVVYATKVSAQNTQSILLQSVSQQHLVADDSPTLSVTGDFTLEAWVKFATLPVSDIYSVVGKWDCCDPFSLTSYSLRVYNDVIELVLSDGTQISDPQVGWSPSANTWYHIAVAYDTTGTVKFYLNGNLVGTRTGLVTSINDNVTPLIIGGIDGVPSKFFDGNIDDVRIYDVARTQSEIQSDYLQELTGNETNLAAYWTLNNTYADLTGNVNTLTPVNGPIFSNDIPFPVTPPPPPFKVRKSINELTASTVVLQNDDQLVVGMEAGKTYIVEGAIFASSPSATPDIRIALNAPLGSDMSIGHISVAGVAVDGGLLETSGVSSVRIQLPANIPVPIMIKGTVVAGATGSLQLQWAQFAANANAIAVRKGSYLQVTEI